METDGARKTLQDPARTSHRMDGIHRGKRTGIKFYRGMRKINDDVTVVLAGPESNAFERLAEREFRIDPANPSHYKKLFDAFPDSCPANLVHFWSLNHDPGVFDRAFHSVLFLAQAIGAAETANPKNLWIVSNSLAEVAQQDLPDPEKAILLGACRTIPLEYSNLHCALIDVGAPERNVVSTLLQCCANLPNHHSWPTAWEGCGPSPWNRCPYHRPGRVCICGRDGVYFITGGLGHIGLTVALHLAKTVKAKLVLLDNANPPARVEWDDLWRWSPRRPQCGSR